MVEIESRWMACRRQQLGVNPVVRRRAGQLKPRPLAQNARRAGHPLLCVVKGMGQPPTFQSIGIPKDDASEREFRRIRTKIELLMNRRDDKYPALHKPMYDAVDAISNEDSSWFNAPFIELCEDILKTEWEVLKQDLANAASPNAAVSHRIP